MVRDRRDLIGQLDVMQREMNRLLDHFAGSKPPQVRFSPLVWEPAVDVYETRDSFIVVVDLAGVRESDLRMTVDSGVFTLEGVRRRAVEGGGRRVYHRMEIAGGPFRKSIHLPVAVDAKNSRASYDGGLVEVVLPKAGTSGSYRVDIKTGLEIAQGARDDTGR